MYQTDLACMAHFVIEAFGEYGALKISPWSVDQLIDPPTLRSAGPSGEAGGSEIKVVSASSHVLISDAFKHPEN